MDWHFTIGITAGLLQQISAILYIKSMLKGTTRPNVVTQILWSVLQVIALLAQFSSGASWSVIILIVLTFNTLLVTALCFMGYGYKEYGLIDKLCFVLAILAIILWQITKEPLVALALSILADAIATLPTIIKTYRYPKTEAPIPWFMTLIASALSAISSTKLNFANLAFPLYMIIIDSTITYFAFFGKGHPKIKLSAFDIDPVKKP